MSRSSARISRKLPLESISRRFAFAVLLGWICNLETRAQVWDGGGADNNWNTAANWNPDSTPGTNDTVTFDADNANSQHDISLNGSNRVVAGLVFADSINNTGFDFLNQQVRIKTGGLINNDQVDQRFQTVRLNSDQSWDLSAGGGVLIDNNLIFIRSLTVDGTGSVDIDNRLQVNNANRTLTINTTGGVDTDILRINTTNFTVAGAGDFTVDDTLQNYAGNRLFRNNSTGTVTINEVSLSNNTTNRTFTIDGSGDTTVNGVVADGGSTSNLTKTGAGNLILNGTNTYDGTTTISAGTVTIADGAALGTTTGSTTVATGANLHLTANINVGSEALTVTGTGQLTNVSGNNSYAGVISGTGNIAVDGGQLTLSGTNTYTGLTTVSGGGVLQIAQDSNLGAAPGSPTAGKITLNNGTLQTTAGITLHANRGVTLGSGGGTVDVTTGTTTYNGIIAGSASGNLTKSGDGGLVLGGANTYDGNTVIDGGFLAISADNALGVAPGSPTTDAITLDGGSLVTLASFELNSNRGITLGPAEGSIYVNTGVDTTYNGNITGSSNLLVNGPGILRLGGDSDYSGDTTISSGALLVTSDNALGTGGGGGSTSVASGASLALLGGVDLSSESAIELDGTGYAGTYGALNSFSGTNTVSSAITLTDDATIQTLADSLTISGDISGSGQTLTINGAGTSTINGNITTGSGSLIKDDAGTLTLAGANTYTGTTTINNGTVVAVSHTALGTNAAGTTVATGATLELQNGVTISGESLTVTGTGRLLNSSDANAFSGNISGTGGVQVTGGVLYLGGDNTFSGVASVGSGSALVATSDNALGSGGSTTDVASGGSLALQGGVTIASETTINLEGAGVGGTYGALNNAAGNNEISSSITLTDAATIQALDASGTLTLSGDITATNHDLTFNGDGDTIVNSAITTGSGGLSKTGTGTLTLSAANTFSGDITIGSGSVLVATADDALGSGGGSTTVQSGGTLEVNGGVDIDTETNISLAGVGVTTDGALLSTGGTNIVDTPMSLAANATIGATSGTLQLGTQGNDPEFNLSGFDLTLNTNGGDITVESDFTGTGDIYKTGSGTLTLNHGEAYPAILSPDTDFFLNDGTTILNTYATENSGMRGDITIGDGLGGVGTAILQQGLYESGTDNSNEIISNTSNITINADGYWDLQGHKEVVNHVTMNGGTIDAKKNVGDANRLDIGGTLHATADATINGLLGLNNQSAASLIVDSGATLDLNATLSNAGFDKTGDGTLILSGGNTYVGNTEISDGIVIVDNNSGLGSVGSSYTRVDSGAQLQLAAVNIGAEPLKLSGTGHNADGTGALRATTGTNTVGGAVALEAHAEIQTDLGATLIVNGNITGSGKTLTVDSLGTTTFNGNNTFNTLEKNGAGTLTVTGTNTYATANVNAGTFALGNTNILADAMDINLGASGTFAVGTYTETIDDLNGSGTLTIAAGGVLGIDKIGNAGAFTGDLDIDGIMTLNGGLIGTGADGSLSTGTMMLNASSTLEIAADFVFGGTLELAANTVLNLTGNGTTFDLGTLHITGDTVIDFSGVDTATFNIGSLIIDPGVAVSATGWESFNDLWTAANFSGATLDERDSTTAQITFNGFTPADTIWLTYDYGANEITVPEPSSYGALLMAAALATHLLRRRHQQVGRARRARQHHATP